MLSEKINNLIYNLYARSSLLLGFSNDIRVTTLIGLDCGSVYTRLLQLVCTHSAVDQSWYGVVFRLERMSYIRLWKVETQSVISRRDSGNKFATSHLNKY